MPLTVVVRGGLIYDGSGAPGVPLDVLIDGDERGVPPRRVRRPHPDGVAHLGEGLDDLVRGGVCPNVASFVGGANLRSAAKGTPGTPGLTARYAVVSLRSHPARIGPRGHRHARSGRP
ncbi:MAG: hypothetical protein M3N95_09735 [Actinomycetota bacterium]|nr:hypothetical protein [Actinomycetota bacterium]